MDPSHPSPGAVIGGKYRIERVLGEGGMGAVYEAVHTRLDQRVAIKMLLPELVKVGELVWRFEREAKAAAQLRHRNTARVVDVDATAEGVPYMVMELLHGHDLESELQTLGRLPIDQAVHYVLQACSAMGEAHALGIVHRDLKPANLFLNDEADGSVCLKVLDFGISKVQSDAEARVTSTKSQMGTPLYMSPEQVRSAKNVDLRTDVWSLGVILYELLAGEPPFTGSAAGIGAAIVNDPPPSLRELRPEVPEALEAAIAKAMQKSPADRFPSTLELSAALAPFSSVQVLTGIPSRSRIASLPAISSPSSPSIAVAATVAAPASTGPSKDVPGGGSTAGTWAGETKPSARPRRLWIAGAVAGLAAMAIAGAVGVTLSHGTPSAAATTSSSTTVPATTPSPGVSASVASSAVTPPAPSATAIASVATVAPVRSATAPAVRPSATAKPTATQSAAPANPERL